MSKDILPHLTEIRYYFSTRVNGVLPTDPCKQNSIYISIPKTEVLKQVCTDL